MREFKFRAWDAITQHYFTGQGMVLECLKQQLTGEYDHCADGMVFEQFTGIIDVNGVPVYEGDIVRVETPTGETDEPVEFHAGDGRCEYTPFDFCSTHGIEVVGNIHAPIDNTKKEV